MEQTEIRLQKYIAEAGVASRRHAEELIAAGRVRVNGKVVSVPGTKVNPDKDKVAVDGEEIAIVNKKYYIILHKPAGYITTVTDTHGRPTVMDLVRDVHTRLFPVGRLDADTEGLLLLTNDGEFANRVIHPSNALEKVYLAEVKGLPPLMLLKQFSKGIDIGGYVTKSARAELIKGSPHSSTVKVTLQEGKKRQVRLMLEAIGHPVLTLKRVEVGPLSLGNLPRGKWRHLRNEEINRLMKA